MKLEFEDPYVTSKSVDLLEDEEEPEFRWALSPIKEKKVSKTNKLDLIYIMAKRQYLLSVALMSVAMWFYYVDSFFTAKTYVVDEFVTPFEAVLIKGMVGFLIAILISQFLNVNVFKFNIQFNLSLDNEEITDIKTMKLWFITALTSSIAFVLEANAIKYVPDSTSHMMVSWNSILVLVCLPLIFKESFNQISTFDIIAIVILVISIAVLMFGQLTSSNEVPHNFLGYVWSALSAIFITISLILLRELNKKLHYIYYCAYFAIGYLLICLAAYTISSGLLDMSKVTVKAFTTTLVAGIGGAFFVLFISLAHKYGKPSQLAPVWSLLIVISVVKELWAGNHGFNAPLIVGGAVALIAFLFPIMARMLSEDTTLTPKNPILLLKRFSSF